MKTLNGGVIRHELTPQEKLKGAMTGGAHKSIAARLRELKKKGLTSQTSKEIYDVMTNSDISALDIYFLIRSLPVNKEKARLLMEHHKMHHGTKTKIDLTSEHTNVDVNILVQILREDPVTYNKYLARLRTIEGGEKLDSTNGEDPPMPPV